MIIKRFNGQGSYQATDSFWHIKGMWVQMNNLVILLLVTPVPPVRTHITLNEQVNWYCLVIKVQNCKSA